MTASQITIIVILSATIVLFLWGRWRHDIIAGGALLACVLSGLVPAAGAFTGFSHPAVITVACVLIMSHALQTSGVVDLLTRKLPADMGPFMAVALLTILAGVLSSFMNNVGALALLMPLALQTAQRQKLAAGTMLMPVAFGSILGGMTTLIGTPPNLIVAGFRADAGQPAFGMFDFTPVGIVVAVSGIALIVLGGWRLVPARERTDTDSFKTDTYLTEARIPEDSKADGLSLYEIEAALDEADAQVIGLVRGDMRLPAANPSRKAQSGDILIIEAEPEALTAALSSLDLKLVGEDENRDKDGNDKKDEADKKPAIESDEIKLAELAVLPDSRLAGRSITDIQLRSRFGINLLAVSRQGQRSMSRLHSMSLRPGDVLLMQGAPETLMEFAEHFGCVPLAERNLRLPDKRRAITSTVIMAAAVAAAATGLLPTAIAFALAVLVAVISQALPARNLYEAIDWPVIVLLAALLPVAGAVTSTGTADLLARLVVDATGTNSIMVTLAVLMVITMILSDFMNNAATAAVMCPIAISIASGLNSSMDPFLMAVAVGASCAFLTPIGHQNNTLILGPGGFRFGDYWRLGLPLEIMIVIIATPLILWIWPV
ncbi:di/tricarboxylate transporter [Methylohalomonas lacus]|uniref:Di/tricarboxylate transporter n=1 Tax=Methylohalomonas lacus TaxID=398773 RepID=A0AAE3L0Y8_9GAMM|nr:SLC13 family permease [Methylohalomonas lacus]MCS3902381.1 di/tricarboxylate transporter [Methylohalomonas lacus]